MAEGKHVDYRKITEAHRIPQEQLELILGLPPKEPAEKVLWFRANKGKLHNIIESAFVAAEEGESKEEWLTEALFSYTNFKGLDFNNGSLACTGKDLLNVLDVKGKEEFYEFVNEVFPEQGATLLLMDIDENHNSLVHKDWRSKLITSHVRPPAIKEDIDTLIKAAGEDSDSEDTKHRLAALLGTGQEVPLEDQRDPIFRRALEKIWADLSPEEQIIVREMAVNDRTLEETGDLPEVNLTGERVRQIYKKVIKKIHRSLSQQLIKRSGVYTSMAEGEALGKEKVLGIEKRNPNEKIIVAIERKFRERTYTSSYALKIKLLEYIHLSRGRLLIRPEVQRILQRLQQGPLTEYDNKLKIQIDTIIEQIKTLHRAKAEEIVNGFSPDQINFFNQLIQQKELKIREAVPDEEINSAIMTGARELHHKFYELLNAVLAGKIPES